MLSVCGGNGKVHLKWLMTSMTILGKTKLSPQAYVATESPKRLSENKLIGRERDILDSFPRKFFANRTTIHLN